MSLNDNTSGSIHYSFIERISIVRFVPYISYYEVLEMFYSEVVSFVSQIIFFVAQNY